MVYFLPMSIIYILLAIIIILGLWVVFAYNRFIVFINRAKEAWSDIDIQLKRRYDLIPNLINTVKGYATHESSTFDNITKARAAAINASNIADKGKAENMLTEALKSVFAVAEAYPDLKANQNFLDLQTQLTDTEDKIQAARRFYNGNVRDLNIAIEAFPGNIIAKTFHFAKMELFTLNEEAAKAPVTVKF